MTAAARWRKIESLSLSLSRAKLRVLFSRPVAPGRDRKSSASGERVAFIVHRLPGKGNPKRWHAAAPSARCCERRIMPRVTSRSLWTAAATTAISSGDEPARLFVVHCAAGNSIELLRKSRLRGNKINFYCGSVYRRLITNWFAELLLSCFDESPSRLSFPSPVSR
jgi:hypothetical protein